MRFVAFLFLLAVVYPQMVLANYCGKFDRGITPWTASRGPGDAYWDRLESEPAIGLQLTDYSATDPESDDHPILEEGGAFFAVRQPARLVDGRWRYEQDRDALWAVVVPHMYQLVIPFPLSVARQLRHVTAHDGNRVYDQSRAVGPEGGFTLDPHGRNAIVLRRGTPEHKAFFDYIREVRETTKRFVPDSEKGRLDVDVDRERISKGLRALFDVLRILSSVSIFFGNMDRTGRSWDWAPGRYARALADPSYRYEDFALRKPPPEPFDTRGDKAVPSRRQSYRNFRFWYLATKRFEELEVQRQRDPQNQNWQRDYFLRQCVDLARRHGVVSPRLAPRPQFFYAPRQQMRPPPQTTSGGHAVAFYAPAGWDRTVIARGRHQSVVLSLSKDPRHSGTGLLRRSAPRNDRGTLARPDGPAAHDHDYDHDVAEANAEAAQTVRETIGE